jgi:alpha-glucosidase
LREGALTMLGSDNAKVLSYARSTRPGEAVVVVLNLDSQAQTVTIDLGSPGAGGHNAGVDGHKTGADGPDPGADAPSVRTLLTDAPSLAAVKSTRNLSVPPFATWIAAVSPPTHNGKDSAGSGD